MYFVSVVVSLVVNRLQRVVSEMIFCRVERQTLVICRVLAPPLIALHFNQLMHQYLLQRVRTARNADPVFSIGTKIILVSGEIKFIRIFAGHQP